MFSIQATVDHVETWMKIRTEVGFAVCWEKRLERKARTETRRSVRYSSFFLLTFGSCRKEKVEKKKDDQCRREKSVCAAQLPFDSSNSKWYCWISAPPLSLGGSERSRNSWLERRDSRMSLFTPGDLALCCFHLSFYSWLCWRIRSIRYCSVGDNLRIITLPWLIMCGQLEQEEGTRFTSVEWISPRFEILTRNWYSVFRYKSVTVCVNSRPTYLFR